MQPTPNDLDVRAYHHWRDDPCAEKIAAILHARVDRAPGTIFFYAGRASRSTPPEKR